MNQYKPAPNQDTETTNSISVNYPADERQIQPKSNTPKSTRLAKKNDSELESVANRSIN